MSTIFDKCCKSDDDCAALKIGAQDICHLLGTVCDSDGHLLRLRMLGVGLRCRFPSLELSNLTRLEKLELGWNDISGDIDSIVQDLQSVESRIEHLGLDNNALTSILFLGASNRENLNFCTIVKGRLSFLDLRNNRIARELSPCLFFPESNLEELHLSGNPLIGRSLPDGFSSESKIRVINMANTGIIGTIPESLGNVPLLQYLDLSGNGLTGQIPRNLGNSKSLEFLNLARNRFAGSIPSSLAKSSTLRVLWLSGNALTQLPREWNGGGEASSALVDVILAGNQIQGEFPSPLARAKNLLRLHIGGNRMSGQLPNKVGLFPQAVYIDIADNMFDGPLPGQWAALRMFSFLNGARNVKTLIHRDTEETIVSVLDVSNNKLAGLLPRFLVNAFSSGQVRIFLAGNTDLVCTHLVGTSCEEYFDSGPNIEGQVAETDPARVDILYVIPDNSDVPLRQQAPDSGPSLPSSRSSGSDHELTLVLAAVVIGSVACLILIAFVAWRIAMKGTQPEADGWNLSSTASLVTEPSGVGVRQSTGLLSNPGPSGSVRVHGQTPLSRSLGPSSSSQSYHLPPSAASAPSLPPLNLPGHLMHGGPQVASPLASRAASLVLPLRSGGTLASPAVHELPCVLNNIDEGSSLCACGPVLLPSAEGGNVRQDVIGDLSPPNADEIVPPADSDQTQLSAKARIVMPALNSGGTRSQLTRGSLPSTLAAGEASIVGADGMQSPSLEGWLRLVTRSSNGSVSESGNGEITSRSRAENNSGLGGIQE